MSAISLSSFNSYRPSQGATLQSAQPQRGTTYGSYSSGAGAARGNNVNSAYSSGTGSAYCPTCGGNASRSASPGSSSYCVNCNRPGGNQSSIIGSQASQVGQGGRVCPTCAYQGR